MPGRWIKDLDHLYHRESARVECHHRSYSLSITLPPLAAVVFLSRGS
jgi:hypothetical protein